MDRKEYMREYRLKNKEKLEEYHKEYRAKNKDKMTQYNNSEKRKERVKKWLHTPEGIRSHTKARWKTWDVIGDLDAIYDIYLATTECMRCSDPIKGLTKHMDHDHDTGKYRAVLCSSCNVGNILDTKPHNQLKEKWIFPHHGNRFRFTKTTKGIPHRAFFGTLEEAIAYKTEYLANRTK